MRKNGNERGSTLLLALCLITVVSVGLMGFLGYSVSQLRITQRQAESIRAFYISEAGLNDYLNELSVRYENAGMDNVFELFPESMGNDGDTPASRTVKGLNSIFVNVSYDGGTYTAEMTGVPVGDYYYREVEIRSKGDYKGQVRTVQAKYRFSICPGSPFDYAYFQNNWGWYYGSSITANGNVRANGQFAAGGYRPTINGRPTYETVEGHDLQNKINNGGLFAASFNGIHNLRGMGGDNVNQYRNETNEDTNLNGVLDQYEDKDNDGLIYGDQTGGNNDGIATFDERDHNSNGEENNPGRLRMPNLSELDHYRIVAKDWNAGSGSTLSIEVEKITGGVVVSNETVAICSDGVYGDSGGENQHIYLDGTERYDDPVNPDDNNKEVYTIVVDGPIVVEGDVIIFGKVKGQGGIYSGRNIYVPDDVTYTNPPSEFVNPGEAGYETYTEQWRQDNSSADAMGLFATENIAVGDFTSSSWRSNISGWLNHYLNESAENKLGYDQLPNTNDPYEDNSTWDVVYYTQEDADNGRIPAGKSVGDSIPESGEDIDGDGIADPRISINDFDFQWGPVSYPSLWGGNHPEQWQGNNYNLNSYSDISTREINQLDGMYYTNHALGAYVGRNGGVTWNGGIVSRIEAIVYESFAIMNHDERFTGGGDAYGLYLPRSRKDPGLLYWREVSG